MMVVLERLRRNDKAYTELVFGESDFVRTDNFLDLVTAILTNTVVHTVRFHDCSNPKWSSKQVKLLFSAIACLPSLQIMSISRTTVTLQSLAMVAERSVQLRELDVWESKLVASEHCVPLFANALKRSRLKTIDLKRVTFGGNGNLDPLFAACQKFLTLFKLDQVYWNEKAVSDNIFLMLRGTKLVELSIEEVALTDGQLCSIAEGLKQNASVKVFTLRKIIVSDLAARGLADALSVNVRLSRLCLSGCRLSDTAVQHIAKMLRCNSTLASLALPFNEVGDKGAIDLAEALQCSGVQHFEIHGNHKIQKVGLQALVQLSKDSNKLESMKVFFMSRQCTPEQLDIQRRIDSFINLKARTSFLPGSPCKRRKVWYE